MGSVPVQEQADREGWSDEHLVSRILAGEKPLYEVLMRRPNQRLFRVSRAILQNDSEAEMWFKTRMSALTRNWPASKAAQGFLLG